MLDPFKKAIDLLEPLPVDDGPDKVMPLPAAIKRLVKPGMLLHLCTGHARPGAVSIELTRAFRGQKPGFTLSCIGFTASGMAPVQAGLVKKMISTFIGDSYPTPGPNPIVDRAWKAGEIEIENWSILTFPLRLLAAAMGVPYLPTKSLLDSSMARDNAADFSEITDNGERFGLVRPLYPDLAFIHAPCADRAGNTLLTPPFGEEALGAWASRGGVVVTVEQVVSTEFVRRYSHLCKIPSYMVKAVCPVPLGAHPGGVSNRGLPEFESYADDYDFINDFRRQVKTPEGAEQWMKDWIDDCPTWDDYLAKLGRDRIWQLKGKAHADSWKSELASLAPDISTGAEYSPIEMMVVAAGRILEERIKAENYVTILAGVGGSNLAAWLGYYRLAQEGIEVNLMAELGFYGYVPRPADPFIFNYRNLPTCKMLTGIPAIMGTFMAGSGNRCIGSIASGQVDMHGNINSTMIPGVAFITGSGGANDICSGAQEVLVTAMSGKNRMVTKLPYISSPGHRVRSVVSELGLMQKPEGSDELILTGYYPAPGSSEAETIRRIKDNCGWDLKVADRPLPIPPPDLDELKLLRIFDPRRQFLGKR